MPNEQLKAAIDSAEEVMSSSIQKENEVELICMSDIEMKPIEWLWHDRIACGKLTVIAGDPGLGKSQLTASIAATVTTGGKWLDSDIPASKGNVIFLSAEDDAADTIKPRFMAAGADITLCHVLDAVRIRDGEKTCKRSFDLSQDIERLGQTIHSLGNVRLVVIDPISAYLGNTDSHNNADMRGLLAPLADMAAEHGVAIILLTHLNKSTHQNAIGRVIGSIGLVAAARAAYLVIKDAETPENRYFIPIKNNIGNDHDGFTFHIDGVELAEGIQTSKICWHDGKVEAQKILYPEKEQKPTATNEAQAFLQTLLANKPMIATEIFTEAEGRGYSRASIQRAAKRLGIKRKKMGMDGGWQWSIPALDIYGNAIEDVEDYEGSNSFCEPPSEEAVQPS